MITVWASLSAAPHRLFFLAGAIQSMLALLLWTSLLAGRLLGHAPALPMPPAWLHAWLLLFGMFPFFVTGFTLTAIPNWLGERGIARDVYVRAFPGGTGAAKCGGNYAGGMLASLVEYLEGFRYTTAVMQDPEALEQVAYEFAWDNINEGVCYVEPRFAPQLHMGRGRTFFDVTVAAMQGPSHLPAVTKVLGAQITERPRAWVAGEVDMADARELTRIIAFLVLRQWSRPARLRPALA